MASFCAITKCFLIESETGYSVNEPTNYAVRAAIEAGIVQLVYEGKNKGLWKFKDKKYTGATPKVRPLPMKQALKKWPNDRLYCNNVDLCYPIEAKDNKTRETNDKKVHN